MLMDLTELVDKYAMEISGALHLGAHLCEESPVYHSLGVPKVAWVEANPAVIPKCLKALRGYPEQFIVNACVAEVDGDRRTFNVTNYDGMSSSLLRFGTHPQFSPDTVFVNHLEVETITVDSLAKQYDLSGINFLNADLQGAELMALQGAAEFLQGVDYLMLEVNKTEVYIGCAKVEQLDALLADFKRVETYWVPKQGWGDALWIRKGLP